MAVLLLLIVHAACMIIILEMTSRVIDFFPWGDATTAGLHLLTVPYFLVPVAALSILVAMILGYRGALPAALMGLSLLMLFPALLLAEHQMWTAWLVLAVAGLAITIISIFLFVKRWPNPKP